MQEKKRSGRLVNRKFYQFLLPTVLSTVAISLNEFVDSIIVSQLLGVEAMSLVGLASPIMLVFAVIYTLIGVGGSSLYAGYAGKQEQERADRTFSVTFAATLLLSVLLTVGGIIFLNPICRWLCPAPEMQEQFVPYLRILIISGLLIIPLQVLINFLPAFGKPGTGTAINLVANGVNLLMDWIFISFCGTGVAGAAMATLTGYAAGAVIVVVMRLAKKIDLPMRRFRKPDLKELVRSLQYGVAPALNQLGYCIKIAFCNGLAGSLNGMEGVAVFTLCMQVVSIASIAIGGIAGAMLPLVSALSGQRDSEGVRSIMGTVMKVNLIANLLLTALFEGFPMFFVHLYNFVGSQTEGAVLGLRLFSLMFLFRGFVVMFMYYFQVVGRKVYAMILSAIDGFAGIIPISLLMTALFGINGLWMAYPLLAVLMLLGILVVNRMIAARSGGKYRGLMLLENEAPGLPVYDVTMGASREAISENTAELQAFCEKNSLEGSLSARVALASEEMMVYTMEHETAKDRENVDMLVKIFPEEILMDIRSIGKAFDLMSAPAEEYSNVDVLRRIASVEYNYVMGMNQTRIRIRRGKPVEQPAG